MGLPAGGFHQFLGGRATRPQPRIEHGIGSGVIISPDGYIVTNNHVIEGAMDIRVTFSDRRIMSAKLIGTDPLTDLAVIKVEGRTYPVEVIYAPLDSFGSDANPESADPVPRSRPTRSCPTE